MFKNNFLGKETSGKYICICLQTTPAESCCHTNSMRKTMNVSDYNWIKKAAWCTIHVGDVHHVKSGPTLRKKKIKFFPIYKEIWSGAVAKSYMRKGFPIYHKMGKYFPIYKEAVSYIWLCNCSILNFPIYEENLIFFLISAH